MIPASYYQAIPRLPLFPNAFTTQHNRQATQNDAIRFGRLPKKREHRLALGVAGFLTLVGFTGLPHNATQPLPAVIHYMFYDGNRKVINLNNTDTSSFKDSKELQIVIQEEVADLQKKHVSDRDVQMVVPFRDFGIIDRYVIGNADLLVKGNLSIHGDKWTLKDISVTGIDDVFDFNTEAIAHKNRDWSQKILTELGGKIPGTEFMMEFQGESKLPDMNGKIQTIDHFA